MKKENLLTLLLLLSLSISAFGQFTKFFYEYDLRSVLYVKSQHKLYATAANTNSYGNKLLVFNPDLGTLDTSFPMLQGPGLLVASDDESYIYVSAEGIGMVRRFNLAQQKFDLNILPGFAGAQGYKVKTITVMPNQPTTIAVLWENNDYVAVMGVYDEQLLRPQTITNLGNFLYYDIDFGRDSSLIYLTGHNLSLNETVIWKHPITALGIGSQNGFYLGMSFGPGFIKYDKRKDRFYTSNGKVMEISPVDGGLTLESAFIDPNVLVSLIMYDLSVHPDSNYLVYSGPGLFEVDLSTLTSRQLLSSSAPRSISTYGKHHNVAFNHFLGLYTECKISHMSLAISSSDTVFCWPSQRFDSLMIYAKPGYQTYFWTDVPQYGPTIKVPFEFFPEFYYAQDSTGCMTGQSEILYIPTSTDPSPPIIMSDKTSICINDTILLKAISFWSHHTLVWTNGQVGTHLEVTQAGIYSVKAINETGCESDFGNPISIQQINAPAAVTPTIQLLDSPPHCFGDTFRVTSNATDDIFWLMPNGLTEDTLTFIAQQPEYMFAQIQVTPAGCISDTGFLQVNVAQVVIPFLFYSSFNNELNTFTILGATYLWYLNGVLIASSQVPIYNPVLTGIYTVAYELDGCTSPQSAPNYVLVVETKEPPKTDLQIISVYPNPADTEINIQLSIHNQKGFLRLFDIHGRMVLHSPTDGNYLVHLEVKDLMSGYYRIEWVVPELGLYSRGFFKT